MRSVYRERLEALTEAAVRHCAGALRVHEVRAGLHVVADVLDADASAVCHEAAAREVEVMPLSAYRFGRGRLPNAIVLGFGAVPPRALRAGMERLARALEAARRARPRLRA